LEKNCDLAKKELSKAQSKQKRIYNVKSKDREFTPGEKVLLLLPSDNNKLLMQWKGPFVVVEKEKIIIGSSYQRE